MNKIDGKIRAAWGKPRDGKGDFSDPAHRSEITYGFRIFDLSPADFAKAIAAGCPFSHVLTNERGEFQRKKGFFQSADYIGIDIDNLNENLPFWTIDEAKSDTFVKSNALLLYTTPSHTPEHPKFRIIFVLPERITDADQYERIAKAMTRSYPQADQSCWNQTRFFYGAGKGGKVYRIAAQTLNPQYVETTLATWQDTPASAVGKAPAPARRRDDPNSRGFSDKQQAVLDRLLDESANAEKGRRSEADYSLLVFACKLGLSKPEIWAMVRDTGKFAERGEAYFESTYANAYQAAQAEIDRAPSQTRWQNRQPAASAPAHNPIPIPTQSTPEAAQNIVDMAKLDERGLAYLVADALDGKALYNVTSKEWRAFRDGYWQNDTKERAILAAVDIVIEQLHATRRQLWETARDRNDPGEAERTKAIDKVLGKALRKLNTATGIGNVERIARRLVPVEEDEFDHDDALLNVRNGTLDLNSGDFRPADPADKITRQANVAYDADALCPKFEAFLATAFESKFDVIDYFVEFMGLALTGYSPDEFLMAYGLGGNGKTVLFNIMSEIFGSYASTVRMEIFLSSRFGGGTKDEYYITRLHQARFVKAVELGAGTMHESLIKELTGGGSEHLTARHPGGRPFDFKPTHSLAIIGNHRPRIKSADQGIRRRPKLIEFAHDFTGEGRRPQHEVEAELLAEASGILNLLVEGYQRYKARGGFKHPPEVVAASADFVEQDDTVGEFLRMWFDEDSDAATATADVYRLFKRFCEDGEYENYFKGQRGLNRALRERGLKIGRRKEGTSLIGYRPRTTAEAWQAEDENF